MQIHQIPVRNALRNYMYILVCEQTKLALAIDPLDHQLCIKIAKDLGVVITHVLNTHHHDDHVGGNTQVIRSTGAKLYAHHHAKSMIANVDIGLAAGDDLVVGKMEFEIMDTPGHTMSHVCLFYKGSAESQPALFCGDTLFNAGVGRCDIGGNSKIMYQTFTEQIFTLADNVRVFPGHDYIENNLAFTLHQEPSNHVAKKLLERFQQGLNSESYVSTIGLEREINTFFRLSQPEIREKLKTNGAESTFIALRAQRDQW